MTGHYVLRGTRRATPTCPWFQPVWLTRRAGAESDIDSTPPKATRRDQTPTRLDGDSDTGLLAQELEVSPAPRGALQPAGRSVTQPSGPGGIGRTRSTRLHRPR